MRIGMLSWESLYSIKVGGVAPHVSELSEALVRRGHEVHIFTRRGDFDSYDKINGVHYQRIDFDSSGDILNQMDNMSNAIRDRFDAVQKLFGRFDLVHGHDWHPVLALNRIKEDFSVPYILTMHSTEWGRNGNHFGYGLPQEISHREWLGCYEAAQVIVTTQRMMGELTWIYSVPVDKINIIPNGIVAGKLCRSLDAGRVKERYGIHPLAPVVLFCGRMSVQKGPDLLVEAIPHVLRNRGDVCFIFIGEGGTKSECERKAWELGVSDACRFLGYLPCLHQGGAHKRLRHLLHSLKERALWSGGPGGLGRLQAGGGDGGGIYSQKLPGRPSGLYPAGVHSLVHKQAFGQSRGDEGDRQCWVEQDRGGVRAGTA